MTTRKKYVAWRNGGKLTQSLLTTAVCLATIVVFSGRDINAQTAAATIRGTVSDASGAVIPGAAVIAINAETNLQRTTTTDSRGFYQISNLPPGRYRVEVATAGFQTAVHQDVQLVVGQLLVLNTTLQVGEMAQRVTVSAEAAVLETAGSEVSASVSPTSVRELPLVSRDFRDLLSLIPGVTPMPESWTSRGVVGTTSRNMRVSVAGGRVSATSFYLDGLYLNQRDGMSPQGVTGNQLGIDVVREFRVIVNNYSAEFGRAGFGLVNMVSRSGTNSFHGTIFEFLRNDKLNARNFFDIPDKNPLRRNQFGFGVGGPIQKDKTFFYLNWEALRERETSPEVTRVPDLNARKGLLPDSQGNLVQVPIQIPADVAKAVMDLYPLPTGRNFGDGSAESNVPFNVKTRDDLGNLRIDRTLTSKHSLFARYTFNDGYRVTPGGQPTVFVLPRIRNQWLSLQEDWIVTPSLVNTARFGYARMGEKSGGGIAEGVSVNLAAVTIPTRLEPAGFLIANLHEVRPPGPSAPGEKTHSYQTSNDVVAVHGRHTVKFGGRVERYINDDGGGILNTEKNALGGGIWTFLTLRNFFAGNVESLRDSTIDVPEGNAKTVTNTYMALYLQDEYRALPNLTLNYGLRWEYLTPPLRDPVVYEMTNIFSDSTFSPKKYLYTNPSVIAPRFGLAWTPFKREQNFVLRAGAGFFHDHMGEGVYSNGMGLNWPYNTQSIVSRGNFPIPYPRGAADYLPPRLTNSFTYQDRMDVPVVYQFNLSLAKSFAEKFQLTAAYVGSQGRHMSVAKLVNIPPPSIVNGRIYLDDTKGLLNPNWGADIKHNQTEGMTYYHSLQLHAQANLGRGSVLGGAYTFSKCMDTQSQENTGDFGALREKYIYYPFDLRNNRGLCVMDLRNRLSVNVVYDLPFQNLQGVAGSMLRGWSLSSIVQLSNGVPFTQRVTFPQSRAQVALTNAFQERPDLALGVDLSDKSKFTFPGNADQYFDPKIFVLQPQGFIGNSGRNILIGPGLAKVDVSVTRTFPLREGIDFQLRTEFFNLFNRVNLGVPEWRVFTNRTGVHNRAAGRISNTSTSSRHIQFALKLVF